MEEYQNRINEIQDLLDWACIDLPTNEYSLLVPDSDLIESLKTDKRFENTKNTMELLLSKEKLCFSVILC